MFFQSPRPFGQHSTSYRSMSNSMHSSSSMTSLQATGPESGRSSAPPVYFASVYDSNRIGPSSGPPVAHTSISSTSSEQAKVFKESGFFRVNKNVVQDRYSSAGSGTSEVVSRNYQISKTTSSYDSGGASDRNMDSLQSDLRVQPSKNKVFQVQLRHANQQPPPWIRRTQSRESHSQLEQAAQNVTPYQEDYQRSSTSNQTSHLRPTSTIPFAEQHIPKGMANQSQPIPIFSTSGRNSVQPIHESGSFPETRVRSTAQFNASQVASDEQQQQQKPVAYQQLERRKNYATLHHVASPKMAPLQRRTSDSGLLKSNDNNGPENIAMFNVARGVRAELEQDPKFRRKADILASKIAAAESVTNTFSSPPLPAAKEQPRQSPSLRQIGNFFEQNVQQFHNMLHAKKQPPIPSVKPFNVEHVRSIFRTNDNNNKNNTSSNTTQPTTPPMQTQTVQNSSLLGKAINSLVEAHEAQKGILHAKLKEDIQTSGIITRTVIDTSRSNEAGGNTEKLAEQKVCSAAETGKHNIQRKLKVPDESVVDKPVNMVSTDKGAEMMKEIVIARSREEPVISQDVAIFEKDYDSVSTLALPRRLNQPFPVDETTCISGSEKDSANITSLPGILLKNGNNSRLIGESGVKTPKRVAFQCDTGDSIASATINSNETSVEAPPSVVQYDDAVDEPLQRLLKLSADIGGDLQTVGNKLSALFTEQRNFIWLAAGQKEPSTNELQAKLRPLVKLMEDLSTFKESKRNTPLFNHISAASEGVQALGWLTVKPTPAPFIKDMLDASIFFVNRVLKEHKDDKTHTDWAKSWSDVLNALQKYVRQVHTTGLVWNSCPGTKPPAFAMQVSSNSTSSAPPPPPPPVLPADLFAAISSGTNATTDKAADRTALFAEINAGEEITKRLKKVTPDMQTHKNPSLRSQNEVAGTRETKPELTAATGTSSIQKQEDKPPKLWLENGRQWNVEYHKNNDNVVVEIGDMKQTVYVFKCENSVIQVRGKINSITLDSCKKTSIVFDSLLSQIEVINCQSVQVQTLGAMPTLSIQKTDGCQVYLSKDSMNAEIITSKSSEMNVLVPSAEDGDFVEFPVPEQFKTVYDGKKLQTTVSDIC